MIVFTLVIFVQSSVLQKDYAELLNKFALNSVEGNNQLNLNQKANQEFYLAFFNVEK